MRWYLCYSKFKWLNQNKIDKFCLNSISENSLVGAISEVDLDYLNEFHELHNDYPLVPETFEISRNMLSNYYSSIEKTSDIKIDAINKSVQISQIKVNMVFITEIFSCICH